MYCSSAQKKFGGDGSCKGACISRQCKNLRDRPLPKRVRAASLDQSEKPHATAKSSRRIRQIAFKHKSTSYDNGDDESAEVSRISSQQQRGAITGTTKANNVNGTSFEDQDTSDDDDSVDEAEAAPVQHRKSIPGAHRWLRRSEDHQDTVFCDPARDGYTPFQEGKGAVVDTSVDPDPVLSSSLAQGKSSFKPKSKTPAKPRTRRTKPVKQLIGKNGIPSQSYLYGRAVPHPTENICVGCLGRRSEELEHEPIIFCDA